MKDVRRDACFDGSRTERRNKELDLNAKIVFEIKDSSSITEAGGEFATGSGDRRIRLVVERILSLRERLQPLLFAGLFCRSRNRNVAGRTRFTGIVCGLRTAG